MRWLLEASLSIYHYLSTQHLITVPKHYSSCSFCSDLFSLCGTTGSTGFVTMECSFSLGCFEACWWQWCFICGPICHKVGGHCCKTSDQTALPRSLTGSAEVHTSSSLSYQHPASPVLAFHGESDLLWKRAKNLHQRYINNLQSNHQIGMHIVLQARNE